MLKNKIIGKKIRNIVILVLAIAIMIGTYRYIDRSRAEKVIELDAIALDNYGYLANEEFKLEARQLEDGLYEVELPESINSKKINQIVKIGLGDFTETDTETTTNETILEDGLEMLDNRIYLTKEQIESKQINIEIAYDVKKLETERLYSKILKYEDPQHGKIVELKGYLPKDAQLQVEEVSQEQLTQIFGDKKIDVAYDIKIILQVVTQIPADEADPNAQPQEIVETIEINPEEYGETCEVSIKDANIVENSQVYHVKEDDTYEEVTVKDSTDGNVSFEAQTFSVYVVTSGEIEDDEGTTTGASSSLPSTSYTTPYLPNGFSQVSGTNLKTGLVIQDSRGNQFVWVEVPRSTSVYSSSTLNYDLNSLTGTALTNAYNTIESELQTYTSAYRESGYSDEYPGKNSIFAITESEYNTLKQKTLKSIFINGGFYVGRYEAGTTTARTDNTDALQTPVIKQNAYPYIWITPKQGEELAKEFGTTGYISSLMFGVQWDLILKYLETNGTSQSDLITESSSWGNHHDTEINITNTSAKYSIMTDKDAVTVGKTWQSAPFNKTAKDRIALTTGANSNFFKQNISDISGNAHEMTYESSKADVNYITRGSYHGSAATWACKSAVARQIISGDDNGINNGRSFRVMLIKDETDTTPPTVTITSDQSKNPTNATSITYTFTFSEEVTGFTKDDVTISTTSGLTATKRAFGGSGSTYTLVVDNSGDGTETVSVAKDVCKDNAGNNNTASDPFEIDVDTIAPTVEITANQPSPTNATSITFTIKFSEPVTRPNSVGMSSDGVTVESKKFSGSGDTYTWEMSGISGNGYVGVHVASGAWTDKAGNTNAKNVELKINIDQTAPTCTITAEPSESPTKESSIIYTFTFSEEVTGFDESDVTISTTSGLTATKGTVRGSGSTYTLEVTNSGTGKETVSVAANKCTDSVGNNNTASNTLEMKIDQTVPVWADSISNGTYSESAGTYSLNLVGSDETELNTSSSTLITSGTNKNVTVTLNGSTVSTSNLSLGTATVNGNTKTFPLTIKNIPTNVEKITVKITINAGALKDTAGNTSAEKTYEFDLDFKRPTVEITANQPSPTNESSITYTFTFSEEVTGFTKDYVTVSNGTKSTFSGSGSTYTLVVTNSGNCTQTVRVAKDVCTDLSGNGNDPSNTVTMVIDRTKPVWNSNISNGTYSSSAKTYTLDLIGSDESALNDSASTLTGKITVKVNGKNATYSLGGATLNDKTKTFPLTITNFTGGDVSISISAGALVDTAGNTSAAKTYSFSIDGTAPYWEEDVSNKAYNSSTKEFSLDLIGKDGIALNDSASTLTNKITVKVNGNNASYSLDEEGSLSADKTTKTFPLTLTNFTGGTVKITISAEALVDTSNNKSELKEYQFDADVTAPVWEDATGTYNPDDQSYTITVTGKDETKLDNTKSNLTTSNTTLTVGGTRVTPTITLTNSSSTSETYQIKWSNHSGGAISFTINAGALVDDSSNTSAQKTYTFDAVDVTKPTWNDNISDENYNWDTGEYTLSFIGSDNVALNDTDSVLNSANVAITTGGTTVSSSNLVFGTPILSEDGKTKTFPLTIKNFTGGSVSITINSGALKDTTGNKSDSKTYSYYKDITRPVWNDGISDGAYDPDNHKYTFNIIGTDETGLNSSSTLSSYMTMTIGGTTTTDYSVGTATTSSDNKTKTFPVTINNFTTEKEIIITIGAGALKDTSNNTSLVKEYRFTPDISLPSWTYQNVTYNADDRTYSVELVGTDERQLNTTLSTLISSGSSKNMTVTCGGTTVTPTLEKMSTTSTQVVYKLTINNYPGGEVLISIDKGALMDSSSNQSRYTEIELPAKDITKPTWISQNAQYSMADGTYTFELVATDNEELDSSTTLVTSGDNQNITVKCGTTTVTPTITRTISTNQIVYTVTITDYPSGKVYVTLDAGAAVDTTGNKSDATSFELPAEDIAKPEWQENPTIEYNYTSKDLVIQLVGTDETALNPDKTTLTLLDNIVINVGGSTLDASRVQIVNGALSSDELTKTYTITISNFAGGKIEISLSTGALEDKSGKKSDAKTFSFDDVIRPIWSMEGDGDYNKTDSSYTLTLKAQDETSLKTASLTTSNSTLTVDGSAVTYEITDVTPESETSNSRTYSVKIPNFTGGTISLGIDAGTLVDNADNQSIAATFSITPDIVSPTWVGQNAQYTYLAGNEISVELIGRDDVQLLTSTLELSDITVTEDGVEIDSSNLSLSAVADLGDGKNGVKYVLTISGYSGGSINVIIPEGTLEDASGNMNDATTLSLGVIPPLDDNTPPVVSNIVSTIDKGAEAIYIEFDITDEWFNFNEAVESGEFTITKTVKPMWGGTTTSDITSTTNIQVARETKIENGKHYKIKFSNIDTSTTGMYGGTVTIKIELNANAVYDLADNGNVKTELYNATPNFSLSSSDAAFIKNSVELNETEKKLIITITANTYHSFFNIFNTGSAWNPNYDSYTKEEFESDILDLTIDGESVKGLGNPAMSVEKVSSTSNGTYWINTRAIKFKITLSNFEETTGWQTGKSYTEWSGNVVLTLGNSLDSAVIISEGELLTKNTTDSLFADFIKPEITVDSSTTSEDLDTVTFRLLATDKYYTPGQSIDPNKVNLLIDGATATEAEHGVKLSFATPTVLEGTRNEETAQYGILQDITITGLSAHLGKGLKLRLGEGAIIDLSGNQSATKDISLFNTLMVAKDSSGNYETSATSGFLGNTSIQRQNIESVEFLTGTSTAPATGTWDVSAVQDGSIIAWAEGSGPYKVYIASDGPIYANQDSSYLFSYIGYSSSCTDTTVVKNLNTLNLRFTTNMEGMFQYCGYTAMTTLNLGNSFDTSKITNMNSMFRGCGYTAMTSLSLGNKFYTNNVTTMENMFNGCGGTAMTSLDLGPAFTQIADTNTGFATNLGKSEALKIYAGEAIYSNKNAFKLSTENDAPEISYTRGTIIPKYKPEWSKVTATLSTDYKTLTIKLQGTVNSTVYGEAIKTVTNKLSNGIVEANSSTPISVNVDGETANSIQKQVTMSISGPAESVTVEIVLSNFEEAVLQSGKSYKEWAGNVALQLATGTLVDSYGNRNLSQTDESGTMQAVEIKDETEIDKNTDGKMFADFVKPIVKYEHADTTIDQEGKTATIVFCVLDKYYESENLSLDNTEIQMDGTDLRQTPVQIGWAEEDITENGNVIGRKYTVTLTELQQNVIASGKSYLDFSGVVSIIVPAEVTDKSGNKNIAKTITVGIDEPENPDHDGEPEGETDHTSGAVIDFVKPIWTNVENGITLDFTNNIATIKVKATDKYFAPEKCTLTSDNVKFYLDGVETSTGITIQITSTTPLTEQRLVNGVQTEVQYGAEYTIKITGITLNSDQAKIKIPAGTIEDQYGNISDENEIILYNRLKSAETETESTSGFLGNTTIQRQDIQNVTFVSGISGSLDADTKQVWDVSAAGDGSILAWTKQSAEPYTIYIGSEGAILANRNSSYLFAHIGFGTTSTVTQPITNLDLLDTSSVTNMQGMFWFCGYRTMTTLDLGENFDTSNVTNMREMFTGCGYTAMTSFDLGNKFNTSNVTDMSWMFANFGYTKMQELNLNFDTSKVTNMAYMFTDCGYTAMTTLTLGSGFDTANVENMSNMFKHCGYTELTELNLGDNFKTSKVTNMNSMFYGCGAVAMTSLTLGNNFNTSAVTDMNSMFMYCGQSSMTILNLGAEFYTTNVTDMTDMFNGCGQSNMTTLDLGPAFTKIASTNDGFVTDCGQMGNITIYVGESIYSNENAFRLSTDSSTEISFTRGIINPKYKPEWTVTSTTYNATEKTLTVTLEGQVNSTDYANAIKTVTNQFANGTTALVDVSIDGEATTNIAKTISGASSTAAENVTCTLTLSNFEEDSWQTGKRFKEWSGNIALQMLAGSLVDNYGNRNLVHTEEDEEKSTANTNGKLFADFIKPEIRYEYSETEINYDTNTVTVYFSITDKYFKGLTISTLEEMADAITVKVDGDEAANSVITKTVEEVQDVEYVVNSMNKTVGKQYKIVIQGLDQGAGINYSGPMSLIFSEQLAEDYSGNKSDSKTITIGIDDPTNSDHDHNTEVIVDVVDPVWKVENVTTTTADLIAIDKYLAEYPTVDELKTLIQVKVGQTVKTDEITITGPTPVTNGVKYQLTIPDYEGEGQTESYEDFLAERAKYLASGGTEGRLYREQFVGDIVVTVPADTIRDTSGNTNKVKEFFMGRTRDTLSPETTLVSTEINRTDKTEKIIFDVTDKYFSTCSIDTDDIYVFIDNVETTTVNKQITNVETLTATIDGSIKTIGKRYTLVLSSFEVAGLENGYDYKGLSGTVSIEIAEGVATDQSGNTSGGRKADGTNTSEGQPMVGDLVDFIKPSIVYRSSETVKNTDEVQIVFDVTDKYFSSDNLTTNDITIMIQDGTDDSNYINMRDITGVNITLGAVDKYEDGPFNKTIDGVIQEGLTNQVIGKTYTVTISNLEQAEIADGRNYLDYSGNVTITLDNGKISDTSNNTNSDSSLTMGIEEPEGTGTKDALDIVRPIWTLLSQNVDLEAQTSTIKLRASDKYFLNSSLTNDSIELWINGAKVETNGSTGKNITIISTTPIYETWIINSVESQVQVGVEYEIKATGFEVDRQQAKLKIPQGTITDQSGNASAELEFMLYSCLMSATEETTPGTANSAFLKNPYGVQRQNIENITFISGLSTADKTKWWDVSAVQDGSIMAWYKDTDNNGAYEVYIGSEGGIFANPDSSYLFSNIGTANSCQATEVITGLSLLNTKRVTNMSYMFANCGSKAMTSLNLGDNFETSYVTNMEGMFSGCGQNEMTTLDLGTKFNTSRVTNMSDMFNGCGQNEMTTFKVGLVTNITDFDTTLVEDMSGMFQNFGHKLGSLTLGSNFKTSNVTDMSNMFNGCGKTSMTTLDLGDNFNTSAVTNMSGMFQDFATNSSTMTSLDLGDLFYTSSVTNMNNMFNGCGTTAMTTLDFGPAFTNIATLNSEFVTNCGKSGEAVILAGQAIYSNMKAFRLSSADNTQISYVNGTINPIYKPEWKKVSTEIITETPAIKITVKGTVNPDVYTSNVDGNLTTGDLVTVYINGTEVNSITKTVSAKQIIGDEVQYTITLSGFEEEVRQSGKNFKEWSGNISLQLDTGTLIDGYGHQNLGEIDIDTSGTMQNIELKDETEWTANQDGNMFADFIKPEFTYVYSEDDIDTTNRTLTVVLDITDRYFNNTEITNYINSITVKTLDENLNVDTITKTITKKTSATEVTNGNIKYDTQGNIYWNNIKVGERYELVITNFERNQNDGFHYSGPMSISFPSDIATDNSNNKNDAKTITIGINEPDGTGSAEIVDLVNPAWQMDSETDVTIGTDSITVKLRAVDKYFRSSTISENDITVKVNGVESTDIVKDISSTAPTNVYDTVGGVEDTLVGKEYTLVLSNIIPEDGGYNTFVPTNLDELDEVTRDTYEYKYKSENGGDISIEIAGQTIVDTSGNKSQFTSFYVGNIDLVKPEVFVVRKTQSGNDNEETIVFNITDRDYDSTDLVTKEEITLWIDNVQIDSLVDSSTLTSVEIWGIPQGETEAKILGHQYTLVISNIAETEYQTGKSYLEYSGTLKIQIAESAAKDLSGNTLNSDTTTITDFVDFIKPEMQPVTVTTPINTTNKTYTMSFSIIDKYLDTTNMVTENEITVYIDGEEATSIAKTLGATPTPIKATFKKTVDGSVETTATEHIIGYTYTLVLSDFEQTEKQAGKDFMEWSGTVKIEIAQNAVNDTTGNALDANVANRTVNGEHVDFIKPVVEKVSSEVGTNTETIYFNIIDKYLDTNDLVTEGEIKVYVDGEEVTNLTESLERVTSNDVTAIVNGTSRTVLQQYKLVLSGFEQSSRNAKDYKDWSGTVSIELVENAVKDTSNNTLAPETTNRTVDGDFVDFIKPDLKYTHQSTDVNTGTKTYTMTFDVTDKYYTSGKLELSDLTILMQNGQKDSNGNEIVYDLKQLKSDGKISIAFRGEEKSATFRKTVDGSVEETATSHVIGHTYTLTISNLEQLAIKDGNTTLDYSGIVTVAVAENVVKDNGPTGNGTTPNGNNGTTITSGVSISGGTESGTATVVDVVDPVWTKVSSSAYAIDPDNTASSTATITFRGTDTYFDQNTFTIDKLKVIVNGSEVTSGITKNLDSTTTLTEERIVNGVETSDVQYGVQYTVTIKGFTQNANQVKIRIPKGVMVDQYGNDSEETDLIVYNVLKSAASENEATSAFLGESVATTIYPEGVTEVTPIERQNIEKVVFVNSAADSKASGVQRVWDVSAQGDSSIIAWTSNTTTPYTVYIGSNDEIFANQNSSYLFSCIGYSTSCTATETIANLDLLNVKSVINMSGMFQYFGYTAMTSLELPTTFDTSNVTDMKNMFNKCGHEEMTTLDLGTNFNTSNVTTMWGMFNACGYNNLTRLDLSSGTNSTNTTQFNTSNVTNMRFMFGNCGVGAMTSLKLGTNFYTTNVTNMSYMFVNTGYTAMTSLSLGDKFDTSSVTNMYRMFYGCGYTAMTTLDLGDKFNTSSVTNMNKMFDSCGYTAMTSLDLGDLFYTTNVQDMYKMFYNCGKTTMTKLDLGPAFTKIPNGTITKQASDYGDWELDKALEYNAHDDFITGCGKSNLVIYVAEKIYYDKTTFKLGQ